MLSHQELTQELRRALVHLDDPIYLETLSLANALELTSHHADLSRGQALCRILRLAIDSLAPGAPSGAPGALEARAYEILYRYAVSKHSMLTVADEVGLSERQAYRELHRAIAVLAQVLGRFVTDQPNVNAPDTLRTEPNASLQLSDEMQRLASVSKQNVDMSRVLGEVVESIGPLAEKTGARLDISDEASGLTTPLNRVMFRQMLFNFLSHALNQPQSGPIRIGLHRSGEHLLLRLVCNFGEAAAMADPRAPYAVATQLLHALGIHWSRNHISDNAHEIIISIPLASERTLLIIDDNADLIALFRRYLRNYPYRVFGATTWGDALGVIEEVCPDLIILDVMMPNQDGWEVLGKLRALPALRRTGIIVCSIINDPHLAAALGAYAFINKPVSQARLLQALEEMALR